MSSRYKNLVLRSRIIESIRLFFREQKFLEIETPCRIPVNAPEEHIHPLSSGAWQLQTSPEICMKRLLCRGYDKIFQISRCWRNGERGRLHLPEFSMLEWYRADADYHHLMRDCVDLLGYISAQCADIALATARVSAARKPEQLTVREAFARYAGTTMEDAVRDGLFDEILVTLIEPALREEKGPLFLVDYPSEMAALARMKTDDPSLAERFELYLGGMEIANGFSELNDPQEQRKRFVKANISRDCAGLPTQSLPEPFLDELGNMPPSAGIALGIDRLAMFFAGASEIDKVVAFTPEEL